MKKDLTELVFILDRSGSMHGLEEDTIGGFNSMIRKQKQEKGDALVSCVLFNHYSSVIYDREDLDEITPMTEKEYQVSGCTALLDAVGGAIHHIGMIHRALPENEVPERTLFVIITDGMENSSRMYSGSRVRQMIQRQRKKYDWEFLFLGANIDVEETAREYGIEADRAVRYQCDSRGTALNFAVINTVVCCVRRNEKLQNDCLKSIDDDYKKRG